MRAKPASNSRAGKPTRTNSKSHGGNAPRRIVKKMREPDKKTMPDLSVLRQPVDTSICGLKQAVKVFETGTPEILHLLTYDCDIVYECKVCRNLFRSIANFISHKRVYCTTRYSRSQDLRANKEGDEHTVILGEKTQERLPTRITARKDLTSIVESLSGQTPTAPLRGEGAPTTVHLEPIDNTSYGVFQTVLQPESQHLMRNQVTELQNLLSQNEVVLGPDGRILQNGISGIHEGEDDVEQQDDNGLLCSVCNIKFANRKTLTKHKRLMHEAVRTSYSCPCCKNYFANPWSVYRHLYKVHRKTNEQVRRLRSQIHKKDISVDKPVVNSSISNKKSVSPGKKKVETEHHQRLIQDNKEWMDHFEDDWELQRCGGCGRRFERKAALISHSQICQKRIAACNRIEHRNSAAVATLGPKKPVPKPSPEKKIGIQVRMNYCKSSPGTVARQQSCSRSVIGEESDTETGKEAYFKSMTDSSVLEQFLKNAAKCQATNGVDKVSSYLNNSTNRIDKVHYEISTCKRSTTFLRSSGVKSLESKCLQLRSALENGLTDCSKSGGKDKSVENTICFDSNTDNTSESNTSAISSLSSQLTPLVDKGVICEVEQSIEVKNINTSLENIPILEADSTSMTNGGGLLTTCNSTTYTENIKFSPNGDATCEEVSTSVISDEILHLGANINVDSSCPNDDEISVDLKPVEHESKSITQESELENTISVLTRNQLRAICKDSILPVSEDKKALPKKVWDETKTDAEVEAVTKELIRKKLHKYIDEGKNICCICKKRFNSIYNVYRHVHIHTRWKRYECLFNRCTFQTYVKARCLNHVATHSQANNRDSSMSLVGLINPSKWNLRLLEKPKVLLQPKTVTKLKSVIHNKTTASQKLMKTVSRLSKKPNHTIPEKVKRKLGDSAQNDKRKNQMSTLIKKVGIKQKLLTEFKNFNSATKLSGRIDSLPNKIKKTVQHPPNKIIRSTITSPKRLKSSPVENGVVKETSPTMPDKTKIKKEGKVSVISVDQAKEVLPPIKREIKDEMIVNHITLDNSESNKIKRRGSRASSRKSSVSSVDQQKGKISVSSEVKVEDSDTICIASVNCESQSSVQIQSPEIVDGSSLEEEESQESDRPVDDSHLKKIFMEVIFGPPSPNPVKPQGRPVRNKTRPKRDSDFILESQRDSDRDTNSEAKSAGKKSAKSLPENKTSVEISRKSK